MKKTFSIKLPYPPSLNKNYQYSTSKIFLSKKVTEYRQKVKTAIKEKYPDWQPFTSKIVMNIMIFMPDKRVRDIDNVDSKVLWDALKKANVYKDDSLIFKRSSVKTYSEEISNVIIVEIKEL